MIRGAQFIRKYYNFMEGISLIITYFKGPEFILKCLDKIVKARQVSDLIPLEVLIVMDSPEDSTEVSKGITTNFGTKLELKIIINETNIGVSKSRNKGLLQTKYRYFTIIDQDDYVLENYFSILVKHLNGNYALYILNGYVNYINPEKKIPIFFFHPKFTFKSILLKNTVIYTPGLIVFDSNYISKKDLFIDTSEKFKGSDDWAAYLNLLFNSDLKSKYINERIFCYNFHNENFSNQKDVMIESSRSVLRYFDALIPDSHYLKSTVHFSIKMHEFYYSKDFLMLSKLSLMRRYPMEFMFHYLFSFYNRDRWNRIVFNYRKIFS